MYNSQRNAVTSTTMRWNGSATRTTSRDASTATRARRYYYSPAGNQYVVALVDQQRVSPRRAALRRQPTARRRPTRTLPAAASSCSITRRPGGAAAATDGTIAYTISDFYADLNGQKFDLNTAATTTGGAGVPTVPARRRCCTSATRAT